MIGRAAGGQRTVARVAPSDAGTSAGRPPDLKCTLCEKLSLFVHVTVSPLETTIAVGANL